MSKVAAGRPGAGAASAAAARMTSMQLVEPGRFEAVTVARPAPGANEVLVRIEGCGVCGSNLPVWEGREWFEYPLPPGAPGHEGWGEVVSVGREVTGLRAGHRVAFLSERAFAEYDTVDASQAVVITPGLEDVPGEPLACAMNVMRRSGIEPGQTVCVIGVGFLGALLVRMAARLGATVLACTRRRWSQDLAVKLGAAHALDLDPVGTLADRIASLADGRLCDVVIEAAGVQATLDAASPLVRTRGRLVIAGFHQDGARRVDMQGWNWRGIDVVNAHERDPEMYTLGMREAMDALEDGRIDLAPLITHRLPLSRLGEAMDLLRDRPKGFLKAVVTP